MKENVRWKLRFQNFEKAFFLLEEATKLCHAPSLLEKEGTIRRFEFTHELAWKVLKDFLESQGIQNVIGSKDATRYAFQNHLIENGESWMQMIESRNKTVYTYEGSIIDSEYPKIKKIYVPLLKKFHLKMKSYL